MGKVAFLLVTCAMEETRAAILAQVIMNLRQQAPEILASQLTVFDNASTYPATRAELHNNFDQVYAADHNVGYWSAIDWWLDHIAGDPPDYVHIIESDTLYYGFEKLWTCADYLDRHPDVGSVRLHRYSVANRHLYDKDHPLPNSDRSIWQSHINKVTGKRVELVQSEGDIWSTTFLTQLPALNRYMTMCDVFASLRSRGDFTELDFQRLYWDRHPRTAIIDGGLLHADLGSDYGGRAVTGSWTSPEAQQLGYKNTRFASITPRDQYVVSRVAPTSRAQEGLGSDGITELADGDRLHEA